jgi:diguanylate cyclase (GGDEF)-like protein
MLNTIAQISKQTIQNLIQNNISPTPKEYSYEFCKIAKQKNIDTAECEYFDDMLQLLEKSELQDIQNNPQNIYDIIDILLKRVPKKNVEAVSRILNDSLKPSISLSIGDDLKSFCLKIGDNPSLIFEQSIQKEMEQFIAQRFEVDRKIVARKTADIARLISLMNKYLSDAIQSNTGGSNNIQTIKKELEAIQAANSTKDDLQKLQTKLVQAAIKIENEMSTVNENLKSGQSEVQILEQKVKKLEEELKATKLQNKIDYLTGALTRTAYEDALRSTEDLYIRHGQDYAIVFFDIDYFKKVNDTYGHEAGDVILKTFASLIIKLTRESDVVGRYGGEEFVSIVHYTNSSELYKYVSRIKSVIANNKFLYKDIKLPITFSAGVELRSNNSSAQQTLLNADKLLYEAKNSGRNKIVFWDKKEL